MCFLCPFSLQSAERLFKSLHLKCHCINPFLKQHNTQTLADLWGFLMPPWKDKELLITMSKYFVKKLFTGIFWWLLNKCLMSGHSWTLCNAENWREHCCLCQWLIVRIVMKGKEVWLMSEMWFQDVKFEKQSHREHSQDLEKKRKDHRRAREMKDHKQQAWKRERCLRRACPAQANRAGQHWSCTREPGAGCAALSTDSTLQLT